MVSGILSNFRGKSVLHVIPGREEYSTVGPIVHPSVKGSIFLDEEVEMFTLDELASHYRLNPGFVKLDVESGESAVLDGATHTITHYRPVILSEFSDSLLRLQSSSAIEVIAKFRSLGYRVIDPIHPDIEPGRREYGDILCVPEENEIKLM